MSLEITSVITRLPEATASAARGLAANDSLSTLDQVEALIRRDDDLSPRRRQEIRSALHTLARALRREMGDIPAHPGFIREQLRGFAPATLGLSVGRWRNTLSLVRSALAQAGLENVQGRFRQPLAPAWAELLTLLNKKMRFGLSRLAQHCTRQGIGPDKVDNEVLAQFRKHLEETLIGKSPREIHRTACVVWNKAAASIPTWPRHRLDVPDYRNRYALPWESFPASLKAELDAYLAHLRAPDVLNEEHDFRALREISIKHRALEVHEFASALVHRGRQPQSLKSLGDLVDLENFREGLRFFYEGRTPGKYLQACRMARALTTIAKHRVRVPPHHLKTMQAICNRLDTKPRGMTGKNRTRLHQLDEPKNRDAFLGLPKQLVDEATRVPKGKKKPKTPKQKALLIQTAVAIEILTMAPLRMENLSKIEIGVHLLPMGNTYRFCFEEGEVKNSQRLGPGLPESSARLVRTYINQYRKQLASGSSTFLFPGRKGRHKNSTSFGRHISQQIKRLTGMEINPHLFRHIAAKLYLAANPGDYGTVKELHGHKNIQTTIDYYCEQEQPAAFERYDAHILKLRDERSKPAITKSKRKSQSQ